MLVTVDGIVIGRRNIGENNCFLDILTEEYGVIEVTAHGVKKITSANFAASSLFSYSTFCLNKNDLRYSVNSSKPKYSFHELGHDLEGLSLAAYFVDLLKYTSSSEQSASGIVRFFAMTLFEIEKRRVSLAQIKAVFEMRLTSYLGFRPYLVMCRECACYECNTMYFSFAGNDLVCEDCIEETEFSDCFPLSKTALYALRYIVYSDVSKIYGFKTSDKTMTALSLLCERYILSHIDRSFTSLDYYKKYNLGQ